MINDIESKGQEPDDVKSFKDMAELLPKNQKEKLLELWQICHDAFARDRLGNSDFVSKFLLDLEKQSPDVNKTWLWHMLIGSSAKKSEWFAMPFDTENGDLEKFLKEELAQR